MGDIFKDLKNHTRTLKEKYGVPCPGCKQKQPKRIPTILLPQQHCKVCGYIDSRPRIVE